MLFSLLEAEDGYDESPILLQKIANYRTHSQIYKVYLKPCLVFFSFLKFYFNIV